MGHDARSRTGYSAFRRALSGLRRLRGTRLDIHLLLEQRLPRRLGDLDHVGRSSAAHECRCDQDRSARHRGAALARTRTTLHIPNSWMFQPDSAKPTSYVPPGTGHGRMQRSASRRRLGFLGVRGSVRALRPSRSRADVGVGRSSDFRAGAPGLLIDPASIEAGSTMAKEGRSPWTLGYSGGTVPDSHRIPCLPVVAGRDVRPPTPVAIEIIRLDHPVVKRQLFSLSASSTFGPSHDRA